MSPYKGFTPAQAKAHKKYMEGVATIQVRVTPERRDAIKAHAAARGESVNGFIGRAITETMERDAQTEHDNQVAERLASELGITADEIKRAGEFSQAIDVIEARFPGSTKSLLESDD